jgi:hypothetical protein
VKIIQPKAVHWKVERILSKVLINEDFEILGLGGAGEDLMHSPQWRVPICISVLRKQNRHLDEILRDDF